MHRFAFGEALAKTSKPRVERCVSVTILKVGVKTEKTLIRKKDVFPVYQVDIYAYRIRRMK